MSDEAGGRWMVLLDDGPMHGRVLGVTPGVGAVEVAIAPVRASLTAPIEDLGWGLDASGRPYLVRWSRVEGRWIECPSEFRRARYERTDESRDGLRVYRYRELTPSPAPAPPRPA